jgi:hypothetical protein
VFADGGYTIRVVASDSPSHSAEDALTGEATSARFEVDNTPPQIDSLRAKLEGDNLHVTFRAVDSFSLIGHAEYSIDAGDWQIVEPVGQISDSKTENYDFIVALPSLGAVAVGRSSAKADVTSQEHTIVVRAYDRFENVGVGKIVVNAPSGR